MAKTQWLKVIRFRTIGDRIPGAGYMLDLSYMQVYKKDLEKLGLLETIESTENHFEGGNKDIINLHFCSGLSVAERTLPKARYTLIKEVSDLFEESYGVRLYIQKDLNDTLIG